MSIPVTFMPIDVPWFQTQLLEAVSGRASLGDLRPTLSRIAAIRRAVLSISLMVMDANFNRRDLLPVWYNDDVVGLERPYFVVENLPERVAELVDGLHHAASPEVARRLAQTQLAILDPVGWNDPARWNPAGTTSDPEDIDEILAILTPYCSPAGAEERVLDLEFASDALRFNESFQPCWHVQAYFTESILDVSEESRQWFEPPDALFLPLLRDHPALEEALAGPYRNETVGLYVRPENVARARRAAEAVLPTPSCEEGETTDYETNALRRLAETLAYAERRKLGFAERVS